MHYTVIYEPTPTGFSAYVPELRSCIAGAADTRAETERLFRSALQSHVALLRAIGELVPPPSTVDRGKDGYE